MPGGKGEAVEFDINNNFLITSPDFDGFLNAIDLSAQGDLLLVTTLGLKIYDPDAEDIFSIRDLPSGAVGMVSDSDNTAYVRFNQSELVLVLDGDNGHVTTGFFELPEDRVSSGDMVIDGNVLYVPTRSDTIVSFDLTTGMVLGELDTTRSFLALGMTEDGLVGYSGGTVYAVDLTDGSLTEVGTADIPNGPILGTAVVPERAPIE